MSKKKFTLTIGEEVLKKAIKHDINISSFLEIRLIEFITLIEGKSVNEVFGTAFFEKAECGYRDLNPGKWLGKPLS